MGASDITTLEDLLVSLFDDNGLRRFVAQLPQGSELLAELPSSTGTPFAAVAFAAAQMFARRGLVHDAIDQIVYLRPDRCADIKRVRDLTLATGTDATDTGIPHACLCNVPRGSQYFIGRDAEMAQLEKQLRQSDAVCVAASVEGMAGIGKTELVIQLVHRLHKQEAFLGGIYWFNAENPDLTTTWGQTVADHLQVVIDIPVPERAKVAVHRLSSCSTPLLLVLDNVESWSGEQRPHPLPHGSHVHFLVTTRHRNLGGAQFVPFEVQFLQKESALRLINKLSRRDWTETPGIDALLEYLDGHALAIELAGVYLCKFPSETPQSYLLLLSEDASVEDEVAEQTRYERTVYQSFMAIWDRFDDTARNAWRLAACFAPEPASYDLAVAVGLDKKKLSILLEWHLISDVQQGEQWAMHRLARQFCVQRSNALSAQPKSRFHRWIVKFLHPFTDMLRISVTVDNHDRIQRQFVERSARYVVAMDEYLGFQVYGLDRAHLDAALGLAPSVLSDSPETIALFQTNIASVLRELGELKEARDLLQLVLDSDLATFGPDHPNVAIRRNNLAGVLKDLGELQEARELLQLALDSDLATFGPKHPRVAIRRNNLAGVLKDLGELQEARELLQLALGFDLVTFGPDHPRIATHRHTLATVLKDLGDLKEAHALLQLALGFDLATFGPDHPRIATHRHTLATVLQDLGELEQARQLLQSALDSDLATFGPNHPKVATDRNNLAMVLRDLREPKQARELLQLALKSDLATFGPDHPKVATDRNNLAGVLKDLGELKEACELLQQALDSALATFGPDHPRVATIQGNLAGVLKALRAIQ